MTTTAEAAQRAHDDAVLDAWAQVKVVDHSPAAERIRQEAAEVRRRRRPAPDANPYTGTIDLDELGLSPQRTYQEYADHYRRSAERFDDRHRENRSAEAADHARWFHAAADALDARIAVAGPQAKHWGSADEAAYQRRQQDDVVLARAQELDEFDETPAAEQVRRDAERIMRQRRRAHADAVDGGVPPCPAAWSRDTPCLNPAGDGHVDWCFSADGETWPRATSYFTPEAHQQSGRSEPDGTKTAGGASTRSHTRGKSGGIAGGLDLSSGEIYGLNASISYAAGLAGQAAEHGTAGGEGYIGHLTRSKVNGAALATAHEMQEAFATAAATAERHAVELIKQRTVQEAYDQAPDAGDKGYLLAGR